MNVSQNLQLLFPAGVSPWKIKQWMIIIVRSIIRIFTIYTISGQFCSGHSGFLQNILVSIKGQGLQVTEEQVAP